MKPALRCTRRHCRGHALSTVMDWIRPGDYRKHSSIIEMLAFP